MDKINEETIPNFYKIKVELSKGLLPNEEKPKKASFLSLINVKFNKEQPEPNCKSLAPFQQNSLTSQNMKIKLGEESFDSFSMNSAWDKKEELKVSNEKLEQTEKKVNTSLKKNNALFESEEKINRLRKIEEIVDSGFKDRNIEGVQKSFRSIFQSCLQLHESKSRSFRFADANNLVIDLKNLIRDTNVNFNSDKEPMLFLKVFDDFFSSYFNNKKLKCRLLNAGPLVSFAELTSGFVNKLLRIKGFVIKISAVLVLASAMDFKCQECKDIQKKEFCEFMFEYPKSCKNKGCHSQTFIPMKNSIDSVLSQKVTIQERTVSEKNPLVLVLELQNEMINTLCLGDEIEAFGALKPDVIVKEDYLGKQVNNNQGGLFSTFLSVNSVNILKKEQGSELGLRNSFIETEADDLSSVESRLELIISNEICFEFLISNFCEEISDNNLSKAFLLLSLVSDDPISLLLIGPSSCGKTKLLEFAEQVAVKTLPQKAFSLFPKIIKESNNEMTIEPGKLALCNGGVCCLDDVNSLPSAQQELISDLIDLNQVHISKSCTYGSVVCRLALIIACKIKEKNYDTQVSIKDNVKLSPFLLNKVDFIVLLKQSSKNFINKISNKFFEHSKLPVIEEEPTIDQLLKKGFTTYINQKISQFSSYLGSTDTVSFKKFISYFRRKPPPAVDSEIVKYLRDFYMDLKERYKSVKADINVNLFFSMVKLVKARAKLDHCKSVTLSHVNEVIEMIKEVFEDFNGETQPFELQVNAKGKKGSKELSNPKKQRLFINTVKVIAQDTNNNMFDLKELKEISQKLNLNILDFHSFVDELNMGGVFLKKEGSMYEFCLS